MVQAQITPNAARQEILTTLNGLIDSIRNDADNFELARQRIERSWLAYENFAGWNRLTKLPTQKDRHCLLCYISNKRPR